MLKKSALVAVAIINAMMFLTPVLAQNSTGRIDSEHSTARLFLASSENPNASVNVGVARSSGVINQNAGDSTKPSFNFTIYPADEAAPKQEVGEKNPASDPDYTVIRFKSTHVVSTDGENFRVTGALTVTHVERVVTLNPSEAYAGAIYGPAVTESVTRTVVFDFHRMSASGVRRVREDKVEWSASSVTFAEDFPELMNAVSSTSWPIFVADERCTMPSTVGEDFSGATCAGETVERTARADVHCEMPSTVGEDFAGEECKDTSPIRFAANQVRMQLDFQVRRLDSASLARSGE